MSTREVNQKELSALLGKTTRTIRNWEDEGLPHRAEGNRKLYPIPEAIQWFGEKKRQEALADLEEIDHKQAKARKERARARMAEIELAKEEARLVTREAYEQSIGEGYDRFRATALNVPGRWGAQAGFGDPREGQAFLRKVMSELLEQLSGPAADAVAIGAVRELPDDFPGRSALLEAGIETVADLIALDDYQQIHGVGPATEAEIREALAEMGHRAA